MNTSIIFQPVDYIFLMKYLPFQISSYIGQSAFMNPMAAMLQHMGGQMGGPQMGGVGGFNSLTGPTGIGTGALPNTNQPVPTSKTICDPAPYTCSLPPPWCQRMVNSDGCVVCYCGQGNLQ